MASHRVSFRNSRGETLAGQLERTDVAPRAWALFAHCFTCTRNIRAARTISRALAAEGVGVLRFDFTGLGESEGEFAETNFSSNVADLLAAAQWLTENEQAPTLLVGHSLGGAAVLKAAEAMAQVKAVVTIAAPYDPAHVTRLLGDSRGEIEAAGEAKVLLAGRPFRIQRQFIEDLEREGPPAERLARLRKALLVMHAPLDETVSIDNASEIFRNAKHPKSFVSLDDADHLLSRDPDARYAAQVLAAWASRYLLGPPDTIEEPTSHHLDDMVAPEADVVAVTGRSFRTRISAAGHQIIADEPPSVGGGNAGPTPYGLLSAALASCTSMTLRMYADRRQLPLEEVRVGVTHAKVHAEDCAECETAAGKVDVFEREIVLVGPLEEAARARLLEIADRCPVHRTLESEVWIRTRLLPR